MSVWSNAKVTYAITGDDLDVEPVFEFLQELGSESDSDDDEDEQENTSFEDIRLDLQVKYHVTLETINGLDMICGYSKHCSGKAFDIEEINEIDLKRGSDYKNNIHEFLRECGLDHPQQYTPHWFVLSYTS